MPTSADRVPSSKTETVESSRSRSGSVARNPPGPPLPTMAPPQDLVAMQWRMQEQSRSVAPTIALSSNAPIQRETDPVASAQQNQQQPAPASAVEEQTPVVPLSNAAPIAAPLADVPKAPQVDIVYRPVTMSELMEFTDEQAEEASKEITLDGRMMGILKGAFECNWFKAKSCLVFGKWPVRAPKFSQAKSLQLMTALTVLRGNVHQTIMPLAKRGVKNQLMQRKKELVALPELAEELDRERRQVIPDEHVQYKGSVGADTVTSDVDVSTGGKNSELAVRAYNEAFRNRLNVPYDPGTVFDLNVYAMDFVHGITKDEVDVPATGGKRIDINVKAEHPDVEPDASEKATRDEEQEIWSLVHVARYLPDDEEWAEYVRQTLVAMPKSQYERQKKLFGKARYRAKGFETRLTSMMEHLAEKDQGLGTSLGAESSWGHDNEHYNQDALRMRAANRIYEDKLLQVKELRVKIAKLKGVVGQEKALKSAVARLSGEISMAQLYANEVYGSGGATVHAVFGVQTKRKLQKGEGNPNNWPVQVYLSGKQWYEAFNDNLGDVMKDYIHFAMPHGHGDPDYWYAAFKMGKYVDRMLDAIPNLVSTGMLQGSDADALLDSPECKLLAELAKLHLEEKDGASKNDPQQLKKHAYFSKMDSARVKEIKDAAISVGAQVRGLVEWHRKN